MKLHSDSLPRVDGDLSKWTTRIELNHGQPIISTDRPDAALRSDVGRRIYPHKVPYNGKLDK